MEDLDRVRRETDIAFKRIKRTIGRWYSDEPLLLEIMCMMEKVPDKTQNTIGIDARTTPPTMKFNPFFINQLNEKQLDTIVMCEAFRILLKHVTSRLKDPKEVSSLASNLTLEKNLRDQFKGLKIGDIVPKPNMFDINEYSHFEDYFRKIMDKIPEVSEQIQEVFGQEAGPGEGESQQGGGGIPGSGKEEGKSFKEYQNPKDALKDYFDPRNTNNKNWSKNSILDSNIKNAVDRCASKSSWGKTTDNFKEDILAAHEPKVQWVEILRKFKSSVISDKKDSTRRRLYRKGKSGLEFPGWKRKTITKVLFAVDVSGSMSEDELAEGFAVINSMCREAKISYLLFDTEIKVIEKDFRKAQKSFKVTGRGGTDVNQVLEYAEKENIDGVIIYSDMIFAAPDRPKCDVFWLCSRKEYNPPVDWGFRAHMNLYEG